MDNPSKTEAMFGGRCTCSHSIRDRGCPYHGDGLVPELRREEAHIRSANDIQHGGDHYRSAYQHWDWAHDLQLNYFAATATAYVARHRRKNGVEDLLKASHYCDKAYELGYGDRDTNWSEEKQALTFRFAFENHLTNDEYRIILDIATNNYAMAAEELRQMASAFPGTAAPPRARN